eukprot:11186360-Lingulodinium_polyedra.AAC.1
MQAAPAYLLVLLDGAKAWVQAAEASLQRLADRAPCCAQAVGCPPRGNVARWALWIREHPKAVR